MKKYYCYATVTGSKYLGIVEANNEKEAEKKAWELDELYVSLCHQCAGECEDAEITKILVETR
jgi:hypothetical protein